MHAPPDSPKSKDLNPARMSLGFYAAISFTLALEIVGFSCYLRNTLRNSDASWQPAAASELKASFNHQPDSFDEAPTEAKVKSPLRQLVQSATNVDEDYWQISDQQKESMVVGYWEICRAEMRWTPISQVPDPQEINVICFNTEGDHFAFSMAGMVNLEHTIYSFCHANHRLTVVHWPAKQRTRVFRNSANEPVQFGLAGMTNERELIFSINGRCHCLAESIPMDEIDFEVTNLAAWHAMHPSGYFCATGLKGYY